MKQIIYTSIISMLLTISGMTISFMTTSNITMYAGTTDEWSFPTTKGSNGQCLASGSGTTAVWVTP